MWRSPWSSGASTCIGCSWRPMNFLRSVNLCYIISYFIQVLFQATYCDFVRRWCKRFHLMCDSQCSFLDQVELSSLHFIFSCYLDLYFQCVCVTDHDFIWFAKKCYELNLEIAKTLAYFILENTLQAYARARTDPWLPSPIALPVISFLSVCIYPACSHSPFDINQIDSSISPESPFSNAPNARRTWILNKYTHYEFFKIRSLTIGMVYFTRRLSKSGISASKTLSIYFLAEKKFLGPIWPVWRLTLRKLSLSDDHPEQLKEVKRNSWNKNSW